MMQTQNFYGEQVEVRAKAAKCHRFCGGWNGFSFFEDSKGTEYAVVYTSTRGAISLERLLSE